MDAEEEGGLFRIGVTLATLQQTGKLPEQRSRQNTTARRGARTTAVFFKKRGNIPNWVSATIGIETEQEPLHLLWPEGKGSETGRWMASGWQIDWIPGLLSMKMGQQHIYLLDRLTDQTTTCPNKRRKRRIWTSAEHSQLQGRPPLMGTLGIHQNIRH